jgi:hypothetical protein
VLPRGRNFCRKTAKWPQKNLAAEKIRGRIFSRFDEKMAEKGPNIFEVGLFAQNLR